MPQKIKNDQGQEIEVFTAEEVSAFKTNADDLQKKYDDAAKKVKELEQESNPNWREARQKMNKLEEDLKAANDLLAKSGHKSDEKPLSADDIAKIAGEKANEKYLEKYRERVMSQFGDKKDVVGKMFDKLANGENLDESKIEEIATQAARAVGINKTVDPMNRMINSNSSSSPNFNPNEGQKEFWQTEEGQATAKAMDLPISPEQHPDFVPNKK